MIDKKIAEYNAGNKKAMGDILALKKKEIFELLDDGLSIKTIKEMLESELNVSIKSDTFYKFVQRQKTKLVVPKEPKETSSSTNEVKQKIDTKVNTKVAHKEPKKFKSVADVFLTDTSEKSDLEDLV